MLRAFRLESEGHLSIGCSPGIGKVVPGEDPSRPLLARTVRSPEAKMRST
jgi:hypothetical protein